MEDYVKNINAICNLCVSVNVKIKDSKQVTNVLC